MQWCIFNLCNIQIIFTIQKTDVANCHLRNYNMCNIGSVELSDKSHRNPDRAKDCYIPFGKIYSAAAVFIFKRDNKGLKSKKRMGE